MSTVVSSQRHCEVEPWDKPKASSCRVENQISAWGDPLRSTEHEELNLDGFWFEVGQRSKRGKTNVTKPACKRGDVEKVRHDDPLGSSTACQNTVSVEAAVVLDFSDVQCCLDTLIGGLITLNAESYFMKKRTDYDVWRRCHERSFEDDHDSTFHVNLEKLLRSC